MQVAVGIGIGLASILFIKRTIDLYSIDLVNNKHSQSHPNIPDYIAIYDINGPMFFGAAQRGLKTLLDIESDIKVVILNLENVSMIDMTALVAFESIIENFVQNNKQLIIVGAHERISKKLDKAGIKFNNNCLIKKENIHIVLKNLNNELSEHKSSF